MMALDRDPVFEAEVRAYLEERGYRVTKARAGRVAAAQEPTRACVHCGGPAEHWTGVGARKPKDRVTVGLCRSCYRFGPWLTGTPKVPADPARYARLMVAWRHAQHRYSTTIRNEVRYGRLESHAHPRLVAIVKALNAAPMVPRGTREELAA